jgi:hypothetical protein
VELGWPAIHERVVWKVAVLVFKAIHGRSPSYLTGGIRKYQPRRTLRSTYATSVQLELGTSKTVCGEGAWSVCGPRIWNALPSEVREEGLLLSYFNKRLADFLLSSFDA